MAESDEELAALREVVRTLSEKLDALEGADVTGGSTFVGVTVAVGTYPTAGPLSMFFVSPQDVAGVQTEGGSAALSARTGNVLCCNIGTGLPPVGTKVVVAYVPNCPVFTYYS